MIQKTSFQINSRERQTQKQIKKRCRLNLLHIHGFDKRITIVISIIGYNSVMIHKIRYFEAKKLSQGVFLQDVVNEFLAQKGENIISIHPIMDDTLLVHYKE